MQVVDVDDTVDPEDVAAYLVEVDAPGRGLQQHVDRLAQQRPGAGEDHHATSTDATTSAGVQPVSMMTSAATITATEPSRSPSTSR